MITMYVDYMYSNLKMLFSSSPVVERTTPVQKKSN